MVLTKMNKLNKIDEYYDQIEYKKLTLTPDMILTWHMDICLNKEIF